VLNDVAKRYHGNVVVVTQDVVGNRSRKSRRVVGKITGSATTKKLGIALFFPIQAQLIRSSAVNAEPVVAF
jgi:hypothetical protein